MTQSIEDRRQRNRERIAKYRKENPVKIKEIQKRSYDRIKGNLGRLENLREWQKQYREENRRALNDRERQRRFGITSQEYVEIFNAQNEVCAICKNPETATRLGKVKALAVDHDHKNGAIRGLLCSDCNTGIGKLKDDPSVLRSAIRYLEKN